MDGSKFDHLPNKQPKKLKNKKISNQDREQLIEMIVIKEIPLKKAAQLLNINYSTAKTILRIFRLEKRISRKNSILDIDSKMLNMRKKDTSSKIIRSGSEEKDEKIPSYTRIFCEINHNLDIFNERYLSFKEILFKSFENIALNQSLINEILLLSCKIEIALKLNNLNESLLHQFDNNCINQREIINSMFNLNDDNKFFHNQELIKLAYVELLIKEILGFITYVPKLQELSHLNNLNSMSNLNSNNLVDFSSILHSLNDTFKLNTKL